MNKLIPHYLANRKNIFKFLIFTAIFSMVFINIYKPFGSGYWKAVSQTEFFLISGVMVISGIFILALSRTIMYVIAKRSPFAYWQYFTWIVIEIAIIAMIYSICIFTTKLGDKFSRDFIELFYISFLYTALVLFLPYSVTWLYFALQDAENMIKKIATEESFVDLGTDLLHFKDDKESLRFSVSFKNLLFIESADNYLIINYLNKGKAVRFILRNSMKSIEDKFATKSFLRCHRSYMINIEKIKVMQKDKDGVFLVLDIEGLPDIPVSKSYVEKITQTLEQ